MDTKTKQKIIEAKIQGKPQKEIARIAGTSQPTVSRLLAKDDVKELVELKSMEIVSENLDDIADNIRATIKAGRELGDPSEWISSKNAPMKLALLKHSASREDVVLKQTGISPSATPSVIQNTFIQGDVNVLTPTVKDIVESHLDDLSGVIDVELED